MAKGRFCVTHPQNESTGRCVQCHRPYCAECVLLSDKGSFCSLECKGRYHDFREREAELGPVKRPWVKRAICKLVAAVAVAAVGYGVYLYAVKKDPAFRKRVDAVLGKTTSKTGRK